MEGGIVFILGAGASVGAGAPVMRDFFQRAKHLHRRRRFEEYDKDYSIVDEARGVLRQANIKSRLDVDNLEDIYTALEMIEIIGGISGFSAARSRRAKKALDNVIKVTLQESIEFQVEISEDGGVDISPTKTYGELAAEAEAVRVRGLNFPLTFLTFNYDIAFDYALTYNKVKFTYCLKKDKYKNPIRYCKLHGSLNWGLDNRSGSPIISEIPVDFDFMKKNKSDLSDKGSIRMRLDDLLGNHDAEFSNFPYIVPPTGNKQALHANLTKVWGVASQALSNAEIIVIIGYSFPVSDQFFKNFFALSTIGNSDLEQILIIDPSKATQKNIKSILSQDIKGRLTVVTGEFDKNMDAVSDIFRGYLGEWGAID